MLFIIFILLATAIAAAPINETAVPLPPGVNACLIVDPEHEVVIGPPPRLEAFNFWHLIAYALEILVFIALATLLRIRFMKRGSNSSGGTPPIPMINLLSRNTPTI
jgi:hypothetical protein